VIVVTSAVPPAAVELLRTAGAVWVAPGEDPLDPAELRARSSGAEAVVCMLHDRIDGDLLDAAGERLRVVANVAVGYDNIDVAACAERGVVVTNTPGVLVEATADLTFALLLGITRRVGEGDRLLRAGTPWSWSMSFLLGTGLQGRTLGLVGYGRIGRAVARRAAAFGMRVVVARRRPAAPGEPPVLPLDELLAVADVVSLHCPLTAATRHLIDAAALRRMRPDAYLINTARGPVVDEAALAGALERGELAGAGLDVFEREPRVEPRLLALDTVLLTPHLGSATSQTREAMAVLAARNVVAVLSGQDPVTPVNPAPRSG
jgi:glyoxylate reductase